MPGPSAFVGGPGWVGGHSGSTTGMVIRFTDIGADECRFLYSSAESRRRAPADRANVQEASVAFSGGVGRAHGDGRPTGATATTAVAAGEGVLFVVSGEARSKWAGTSI